MSAEKPPGTARVNAGVIRTDTDRMMFLAGCGSDDGPIVEGFVNVLQGFYEYIGDVLADKFDTIPDDLEANDDDKLEAFRRLIDAAIDAYRSKSLNRWKN